MKNHLGIAIRKIREEKSIGQESLASSINCTRSAIANYESGKRQTPTEKIKGIARHLDVSPLDLLEMKLKDCVSEAIEAYKRSE
ncbi:MAG: helix-turn-helix transcriptional regulator [Bdellovibrio sp.]